MQNFKLHWKTKAFKYRITFLMLVFFFSCLNLTSIPPPPKTRCSKRACVFPLRNTSSQHH